MASYWTIQRRSKRKVEEYLCNDDSNLCRPSRSNNNLGPENVDEKNTDLETESSYTSQNVDCDFTRPGEDKLCVTYSHSEKASRPTQELISEWAISHNISHASLKDLLSILRDRYDAQLPVDPCTLCGTPVGLSHNIEKICGGEYNNFGLKAAIK